MVVEAINNYGDTHTHTHNNSSKKKKKKKKKRAQKPDQPLLWCGCNGCNFVVDVQAKLRVEEYTHAVQRVL